MWPYDLHSTKLGINEKQCYNIMGLSHQTVVPPALVVEWGTLHATLVSALVDPWQAESSAPSTLPSKESMYPLWQHLMTSLTPQTNMETSLCQLFALMRICSSKNPVMWTRHTQLSLWLIRYKSVFLKLVSGESGFHKIILFWLFFACCRLTFMYFV